jgi:hypothetical protein
MTNASPDRQPRRGKERGGKVDEMAVYNNGYIPAKWDVGVSPIDPRRWRRELVENQLMDGKGKFIRTSYNTYDAFF